MFSITPKLVTFLLCTQCAKNKKRAFFLNFFFETHRMFLSYCDSFLSSPVVEVRRVFSSGLSLSLFSPNRYGCLDR